MGFFSLMMEEGCFLYNFPVLEVGNSSGKGSERKADR